MFAIVSAQFPVYICDAYILLCRLWSRDLSLWLPLVNLMYRMCLGFFHRRVQCGKLERDERVIHKCTFMRSTFRNFCID